MYKSPSEVVNIAAPQVMINDILEGWSSIFIIGKIYNLIVKKLQWG